MATRPRKVAHKVINVGWQNNSGIWMECECDWTTCLGYDVTVDDITKAAALHRKDTA